MSTAELPTSVVLRACEAFMAARQARIDADHEAFIACKTKPRLFLRQRTREEAIKLGESDCWSDWAMAEVRGGMRASIVEDTANLARAAQLYGRFVIDLDDCAADALGKYLTRESP